MPTAPRRSHWSSRPIPAPGPMGWNARLACPALWLVIALLAETRAHADDDPMLELMFPASGAAVVDSASRREQSAAEAPAIVTVLTRQDIRELGLRTLYDALRLVPGFADVQDIDDFVVGSRGIVSDNNYNFVVLINGHNVTGTFNLGINPNHLFPMTLENVTRIEVLRGPGSVLWGAGALLGVINIVTEDGTTFDGAQVGGGYGNRETVRAHAKAGVVLGEGESVYASGKFYQSNGTEAGMRHFVSRGAQTGADSDGDGVLDIPYRPRSDRYETGPSYEVFGEYQASGFDLTLRALDSDGADKPNFAGDTTRMLSNYVQLGYTFDPTDTVRIRAAASGDVWKQRVIFRDVGATTDFEERWVGGTILADAHPHQDHRFTLGVDAKQTWYEDYSHQPTRTGRRVEESAPSEVSPFAQYEWATTDWLTLTGALRYSYFDIFDDQLEPKVAVRLHPTAALNLKYIYQTGFLRPSGFQYGALVLARPGQTPEDVAALERAQRGVANEEMRSHELQLAYEPSRQFGTSITGFFSQLDDLIIFNSNNASPTFRTFVNYGSVESFGVEWEGHAAVGNFRQEANVSLARAFLEDSRFGPLTTADQGGQLLNYPQIRANLISRFRITEDVSLATIVRISAAAEYFPSTLDRRARDAQSAPTAALLDLNLAWSNFLVPRLELGLTVFNAFDTAVRQPLAANEGSATPERFTVYGSLAYKFL